MADNEIAIPTDVETALREFEKDAHTAVILAIDGEHGRQYRWAVVSCEDVELSSFPKVV